MCFTPCVIEPYLKYLAQQVGVVGGSLFRNGSLKVFGAGGVLLACTCMADQSMDGESLGTSLPLPASLDERIVEQSPDIAPEGSAISDEERARLHAAIGEAAMVSGEHGTGLKLPWESGGFALIFGDQKVVDFAVPEVPFPVVPPGASQDTAEKIARPAKRLKLEPCGVETFRRVINFKQALDDETLDQNKWARVLEKWYTIIGENWSSSMIGVKVSKLPADEGIKRIRELFGKKSVATVERRGNSMLGYICRWHKVAPGEEVFPLKSGMLDDYLEWLQANHAKISAMHSFHEAINFSHFVVGIEIHVSCRSLWSPWAAGLLGWKDLERAERQQSDVLTVGEVTYLELVLDDESRDPLDRYAAGAILFAIYSISRCADLRVVEGFILDISNVDGNQIGFIECKTRSHKCSRQVAQQGLAMPLVAPIMGVRNVSWGLKFIEVAKAVRLGLEGRAKGPLLPAPTEAGSWSKRAVTSGEMTRWLQALLKGSGSSSEATSHSLKSTTLSWCSKFGMDRHPRLQLGHHSTGDGTLNTYGKDFLAPALRQYITVIEAVRRGIFMPDVSRSGHFNPSQSSQVSKDEVDPLQKARLAFAPQREGARVESAPPRDASPGESAVVSDELGDSFSLINETLEPEREDLSCQSPDSPNKSHGELGGVRLEEPQDGDGGDESSSSSSSSETASEFEDDSWTRGEGFKCQATKASECWSPEVSMYRHKKSFTIHHRSAGSSSEVFVCGRKITQDYELIEASAFRDLRTCKQCAAGKPLRDTGSLLRALEARVKD